MNGDPHGPTWGGHEWASWRPVSEAIKSVERRSLGLYRIRGVRAPGLVYVGEGLIRTRLGAHLGKMAAPENRQGQLFVQAAPLECSWDVSARWLSHQRLELETDLIAAHVLTTGSAPAAQFLGLRLPTNRRRPSVDLRLAAEEAK